MKFTPSLFSVALIVSFSTSAFAERLVIEVKEDDAYALEIDNITPPKSII